MYYREVTGHSMHFVLRYLLTKISKIIIKYEKGNANVETQTTSKKAEIYIGIRNIKNKVGVVGIRNKKKF